MPLPIYFAPLQGYTDPIYRSIHQSLVGGVERYYAPFLRWERGGLRNKDRRDLQQCAPAIPQIIAANPDEFCHLCDAVQQAGHKHINLNMGCPFPMQTGAGRGSALLPHPDRVEALLQEMERRQGEATFSLKMRLGLEQPDEALALLPLINGSVVEQVIIHPRVGKQQYKGNPLHDAFSHFYQACTKPLIYNGDISTPQHITDLQSRYPRLSGVMIGRGLLSRPSLPREYALQEEWPLPRRLALALQMHSQLLEHVQRHLQGDSQQLARLRAFWEYQPDILPPKHFKRLMKCGTMRHYLSELSLCRPNPQ